MDLIKSDFIYDQVFIKYCSNCNIFLENEHWVDTSLIKN
jgi:hypothetical protein